MRSFDVTPALDHLTETYPPIESLLEAVRQGKRDAHFAMARLWLSEGIPFAFRTRPGVYEALRDWLARRLNVQAKEVTIIGSGRQGVSLSPDENVGRPFGNHSDLDFTVVSSILFQRLEAVFQRWSNDYSEGRVSPRHSRERQFWDANRHICPCGLARGFIDPHKIPTWKCYTEAHQIAQAMYLVREKLKITLDAPVVRKVSIRVYRDWDSFTRQMVINLEMLRTL
jgi:hypothetical protein